MTNSTYLTEYQKFSQKKRLEGKSFQEISELWKKRKNHPLFTKHKYMQIDLDKLIQSFLEWYPGSIHEQNENTYNKEINEQYLTKLDRQEFINFFIEFVKEGGKVQSGGQRKINLLEDTFEKQYEEIRNYLLKPFSSDFSLEQWLKEISNYQGFGEGIATIYLNRIDSSKYAIVNNKSKTVLEILGVKISNSIVPAYNKIKENENVLIRHFPELKDFYKTDALTHFLIGTEKGKEFLFEELIKNYKIHKREIDHSEEFYKYQAIKTFQDYWNIEAQEFHNMLKKALSKQLNLMYHESHNNILKIAEQFPEETRNLFSYLYNEDVNLSKRISHFSNESARLIQQLNPKWNSFQEERAISVYLTFRFPDKHFFYKYSYYEKFVKLLGHSKAKNGERYPHYLAIIQELRDNKVSGDSELLELTNAKLPADAWPDQSQNVLTQDILYCVFDKTKNYWIFQCKPSQYDIEKEWMNASQDSWKVTAHKKDIKKGDKVIMWVTGNKAGCYGLCTVTSDVYSINKGEDVVDISIDYNLIKKPITKDTFDNYSEFTDFKGGNQGTNLIATKEQYKLLEDIAIGKSNGNTMPLNQILYGPPGTGKTYQTVNYALSIIEGKSLSAITKEENQQGRESLIKRYTNYIENGQISFITFHQSFSYEDFIEGIKPVIQDDNAAGKEAQNISYKLENGIFKNIAENAATYRAYRSDDNEIDLGLSDNDLANANFFKISLGDVNNPEENDIYEYCIKNNCITIGYGQDVDYTDCNTRQEIYNKFKKFYPDESDFNISAIDRFKLWLKKDDIVFISNGVKQIRAIGKVADNNYFYDQSSEIFYNHFRNVNWLATNIEIPINEIYGANLQHQTIYQLKNHLIKKDFLLNKNKPEKVFADHVLIIDEINRGNISKIFGELITLIESDKREGQANATSTILPYSKEPFTVPHNLYIIGTMNTADRSIALIDTALRRRFKFKEIQPEPYRLGKVEGVDLKELLTTINKRIEFLFDRDHKIGHSYLMGINSLYELSEIFANKIIPLLQEYFYNDWEKIRLVLGDNRINPQEINIEGKRPFLVKKEGFNAYDLFGDSSIDDLDEKEAYKINEDLLDNKFAATDFQKIYTSE